MSELAGELTALVRQMVADHNRQGFYREPLLGFSAADDPLYGEFKTRIGPWHKHPRELLPEAQTVITFFIPFTRAVVEANRRSTEGPAKEWVHSYHHCNSLIDLIGEAVASFLRERGYSSRGIHSTDEYDPVQLVSGWSHRSAALVAGLGSLGLNRMLITDKGCAGRLGTVLTAAVLPPTPRTERERCLYYADGSCRYCLDHCPRQALSADNAIDLRRRSCLEQCERPTPYRTEAGGAQCCGKCVMGPCAYYD